MSTRKLAKRLRAIDKYFDELEDYGKTIWQYLFTIPRNRIERQVDRKSVV